MAIFSKNRRSEHSLAGRLITIAVIVGTLLLASTAFLLIELNRSGVERSFDRRLQLFVRLLVTDMTNNIEDNEQQVGNALSEPLFELPQSGWYWQISRILQKEDLEPLLSRSMWDWQFPPRELGAPPIVSGYIQGPEGQRLRYIDREIDLARLGKFRLVLSGNESDMLESIRPFNFAIYGVFSLIWLGLIIGTFFQVRYGLKPLKLLTKGLAEIRNGQADKLKGNFPLEISPLTRELNALIETNKDIVDRARTHVGNLAHALKTPLSVLKNEADNKTLTSSLVSEQVSVMQRQVHSHLERAKIAARAQYSSTILEIEPIMGSLLKTMQRIHRDRSLTYSSVEGIKWRGEAEDFMELSGNLIDNAFKWSRSEVKITLSTMDENFILTIEDDGKGLSDEEMQKIGQRGVRLDETKQGSGLGLSIAGELIKLYRGEMRLEKSELGGLKVRVTLPLVLQV